MITLPSQYPVFSMGRDSREPPAKSSRIVMKPNVHLKLTFSTVETIGPGKSFLHSTVFCSDFGEGKYGEIKQQQFSSCMIMDLLSFSDQRNVPFLLLRSVIFTKVFLCE
jgi:hypothetical protein